MCFCSVTVLNISYVFFSVTEDYFSLTEYVIFFKLSTILFLSLYVIVFILKLIFQIAAASRIPGVTPSSVFRLLRFVKQQSSAEAAL